MTDKQNGQTPSKNPDNQPLTPSPNPPLVVKGIMADSTASSPNQENKYSNKSADKLHPIYHATFWVQLGLGLIGIGAVAIYYCQLQQMTLATKATQDAVGVASRTLGETERSNGVHEQIEKNLLEASIDSSELDQRAWVAVSDLRTNPSVLVVGEPLTFIAVFKNTGRTPAKGTHGYVTVDPELQGHSPKFSYKHLPSFSYGLIPPEGTAFASIKADMRDRRTGQAVPITQEVLDGLKSESIHFYVHGIVYYEDVFHITHWTKFCYFLRGPQLNEFSGCNSHNNADTKKR
jgi:hypothetical protein